MSDQNTPNPNEQQKTPEQVLAEAKLKQDAEAAKKQGESEEPKLEFFNGKKRYRPILPAVIIPGLGRRSAIEICTDKKAQDYLIKEGCVGSVIEEVK